MGALSKLDEFPLNLQVRTCSVVVPGTSRNSGSENREPTGHCYLGDPCPEAVLSTYPSSNPNDSKQEEAHHNNDQFSKPQKDCKLHVHCSLQPKKDPFEVQSFNILTWKENLG